MQSPPHLDEAPVAANAGCVIGTRHRPGSVGDVRRTLKGATTAGPDGICPIQLDEPASSCGVFEASNVNEGQ
jgi:hypothetical protein